MGQPATKKQLAEWSKRNHAAFGGLLTANSFAPVTGDIQSGLLAANDLRQGNYGDAALNAVGLLPFVPGLAGMFIGKGSKVWDALKAEEAQKLAAKGVDPKEIWSKTGTFQGVDGHWRQEIPDTNAVPGNRLYSWGEKEDFKAGNGVSVRRQKALLHPELSAAYPETKQIMVSLKKGSTSGSYADEPFPRITTGASAENGAADKSIMLHEIQHSIQDREGWARGGNPDEFGQQADAQLARDALSWRNELMRKKKELPNADLNVLENKAVEDYYNMGAADWLPPTEARDLARQPYVLYPEHYPNAEGGVKDLNELVKTYGLDKRTTPYTNMEAYQRLAGEAEARATQARMNMTMPERLKIFPFDSYDVPKEQLIIRGLLGGF